MIKMTLRLALLLWFCGVSCAAWSQGFTGRKKNGFSVSTYGLLLTYAPRIFEETPTYSGYKRKKQMIRWGYYRSVHSKLDLRISGQFYNRESTWGNGKNIIAYGESSDQFTVFQAGLSHRFTSGYRLSPFVDLGVEAGKRRQKYTYWETEYVPQISSQRYIFHRVTNEYAVWGPTINLGLHFRISQRLFLNASVGLRQMFGIPLKGSERRAGVEQNPFRQSELLHMGFVF
jgi:hypothetical protein